MAIAIKSTPVLKGTAASAFRSKASKVSAGKSIVKLSREAEVARKILKKAKLS